jgi:Fe-S oxidoreductase
MRVDSTEFREFRKILDDLGEYASTQPLSDEEALQRVKRTFASKIDGHVAVDIETCIHCGMCARSCHFYEATQNEELAPVYKFELLRRFYRREMSPLRWLFRPFTSDISARDLEKWQELVYEACTSCGRCDMMCPMGINISRLINITREGLASARFMPTELRALQEEQQDCGTVFGIGKLQLVELVEKLKADGIMIPLDRDRADVLLLTTAEDVLLFPEALAASARILNKSGVDWTLHSDAFEAANLGLVSGDEATQVAATKHVVDRAVACGATIVVLPELGHAYQAMRWESANEVGEALPFEVLAMSEFIVQKLHSGALTPLEKRNGTAVAYHDPCRMARHGGVMQQPRDALAAVGIEVRETESNRREGLCCGGGCGEYVIKRSAALRQKAFEIRRREFDDTGAEAVVTSCANCRINLMIGADNAGWDKPVISLVETVADRLAD